MLLREIHDDFIQRFKLQSSLRGQRFIELTPKTIASMIARGQQDIQRRLLIVETSYSVPIVSGTNVYNLPANFGRHKIVVVNGFPIKEVTSQKLHEIQDQTGEPQGFAILVAGNTQKLFLYPTPTNDIVTLYYHPDFNYYQPSESSAQNWGSFDGSSFSGKLALPDRYVEGVLLYMLGQIFQDYKQEYELEVRRLRSSRVASIESSMGYFLGIDNETTLRGVQVAQQVSSSVSGGGGSFSKSYKFTITDGIVDNFSETGWDGDVNAVRVGDVVTVSSVNGEFPETAFVVPNSAPAEILVSYTNAFQILLTLPADYATRIFAVEIGVW